MDIIISNSNKSPIYQQIYNELKRNIISGNLKEEEMLPSIRNLAKDLKVSVITTKRAYEELEKSGYIYTVAGKGSYVSKKNKELIKEENLSKIEEYIMEIQNLSNMCCMSDDELLDMIETFIKL